jgi:mono/diheme cytochrome c family protein
MIDGPDSWSSEDDDMAWQALDQNECLRWLALLFGAIFTASVLTNTAVGQTQRVAANVEKSNGKNEAEIARGKYLVEGVAMCGMCHTPRQSSGALDMSRWLEGASVWLRPTPREPNEPQIAPRLAGTPPGSDEELITLLTTGMWRGGHLRAPMPQFRMSREDAESVVAYLRSLGASPDE